MFLEKAGLGIITDKPRRENCNCVGSVGTDGNFGLGMKTDVQTGLNGSICCQNFIWI